MADWTTEEDEKLRHLHANGLTPSRMVDYFPERTKNGIIGRLNKLGLRTREAYLMDNVHQASGTHELIIRLRCDPWRWPAASISRALGVKPEAVHNVINRHTEPA